MKQQYFKVYKIICTIIFLAFSSVWAQNAEELLSSLIQIKSESGSEKKAADYLSSWCEDQGFYVQYLGDTTTSYNFIASIIPLSEKKPNIVLMSHLDVVPVIDPNAWAHPPFEGKIVNDTVWGRGAIDCKGLAVMQLMALKAFKNSANPATMRYNISFLGVIEEETDSKNGASYLVENCLELINPVVVFGEGGSGLLDVIPSRPETEVYGISVAEKNSLWLQLEVENKSHGHGAVPPDLYANKKLIKVLINLLDEKRKIRFNPLVMSMFKELGRAEGGIKGFIIRHINWGIFWPFVKKYFREGEPFNVLIQNTFTITNICSSAEAVNQICDKASATLDCRLLPGTDPEKFIKLIKRSTANKVIVTVISKSPDAEPSPITPFYNYIAESIKEINPNSKVLPILFPASTDNNFFRQKGIPTYGIIPVKLSSEQMRSVHSSNERICITDLYKGISIYQKMMDKVLSEK